MTRRMSAILIAGDDVGGGGDLAPGAAPAVEIIAQDLGTRFAGQIRGIVPLARPTIQDVRDAFAELRPHIAPGDLFVVMFAGHGSKPSQAIPGQSWYLTVQQRFDDIQLADELLALRPGVDSVVISDCCYGEGFFHTGANLQLDTLLSALRDTAAKRGTAVDFVYEVEQQQLAAQVPTLGHVLRERFAAEQRDSPMVCISAAGKDSLVDPLFLPDVVRYAVHAARDRQTYAQLNAFFAQIAAGHRTFHVDARPCERFDDRVLGV